jgi:hypothetical protein
MLLTIGVRMHYAQRSYETLLKRGSEAGVPLGEIEELKNYVKYYKVDQKKQDAITLLSYIANLPDLHQSKNVNFKLQYTNMLDNLIDKDICVARMGDIHITADKVVKHAAFEYNHFTQLVDHAYNDRRVLQEAYCNNIFITKKEYRNVIKYIKNHFCNGSMFEISSWIENNFMTRSEFRNFVIDWAIIEKMKNSPSINVKNRLFNQNICLSVSESNSIPEWTHGINTHIIRQIRMKNLFTSIVSSLINKEEIINERPIPNQYFLNEEQIYTYYFQFKGVSRPNSINRWANELGFSNIDVFKLEIIKYCYYLENRAHYIN